MTQIDTLPELTDEDLADLRSLNGDGQLHAYCKRCIKNTRAYDTIIAVCGYKRPRPPGPGGGPITAAGKPLCHVCRPHILARFAVCSRCGFDGSNQP